jgi:hypothetical protein
MSNSIFIHCIFSDSYIAKESYLEQMKAIMDGVVKTIDQAESEGQKESASREILNTKHSNLLEKQRNYFKVRCVVWLFCRSPYSCFLS